MINKPKGLVYEGLNLATDLVQEKLSRNLIVRKIEFGKKMFDG